MEVEITSLQKLHGYNEPFYQETVQADNFTPFERFDGKIILLLFLVAYRIIHGKWTFTECYTIENYGEIFFSHLVIIANKGLYPLP